MTFHLYNCKIVLKNEIQAKEKVMARKKGNKATLTGAERTRMFRQRNKLLQIQNQRVEENLARIERNLNVSNEIETTSNDTQANSGTQMENQLRCWAAEHRVSKRALNDLLSVLKSNGMSSLPKNYRTLQKTPTNIELIHAAGGRIWYNGLENSLINVFSTLARDISIHLKFNADGTDLFNSSNVNFWPLLASIVGT